MIDMYEHLKLTAPSAPINQLAGIGVPKPTQLLIKPWDKTVQKDIERGIIASDLGMTPQNDGEVIRLNVPPLSEERRKELASQAKEAAESCKVGMRNVRRDGIKQVEALGKSDNLSEDIVKNYIETIGDTLKNYESQADLLKAKSNDLLTLQQRFHAHVAITTTGCEDACLLPSPLTLWLAWSSCTSGDVDLTTARAAMQQAVSQHPCYQRGMGTVLDMRGTSVSMPVHQLSTLSGGTQTAGDRARRGSYRGDHRQRFVLWHGAHDWRHDDTERYQRAGLSASLRATAGLGMRPVTLHLSDVEDAWLGDNRMRNAALYFISDTAVVSGKTTKIEQFGCNPEGKGVNVARVLHAFGHDVELIVFAGGATGHIVEAVRLPCHKSRLFPLLRACAAALWPALAMP